MAKILEIKDETFKIELRQDFKYDNESEEEQMKMLNQDIYLGDGIYQLKYCDFVKICLRTPKDEKLEEYKINNLEPPSQIKNDQDLDQKIRR